MRERRQEGGETGQGQSRGEEETTQESESQSKSETLHGSVADPLWHEHQVFDPPNVLICEVYLKPLLSMLSAS